MELKFRAWHEENSVMVYFDADKMSCDTYIAGHFINLLGRGLLEQFTGLTDNTGKDYYIGDIGEFENGDKFCLKMEDEMLEVYVDWIGEAECEDQARDLDSVGRAKIIGNIHQHSHLLGGNNND